MESNQPFGLFRPALIHLSYPTFRLVENLERAVRLELTCTGFAIRRLSRLATRASWNGRRDSNSRIEFGRLACFQLHHFRIDVGTPGRTRTRNCDVRSVALFPLSYRSKKLVHRTGFEPMSQRWQRRVLDQLDQRCKDDNGRGGQNRTVATSAQDSDANTTPHPESWCAR